MRHSLLLLLASLVAGGAAAAQGSPSPIQSGSRVRLFVVDTVRPTGDLHYTYPEGTVLRVDERALVLRPDSGGAAANAVDTVRVPLSNIGSVETFGGRKRHAVIGGAAGLVVGGVVGLIFGNPAYGGGEQCYTVAGSQFCGTSARHGDTQGLHAAKFGAIGAVAGAVLGHFVTTERWTEIDLGSLRVQPGIR